MAAAVRNLLLAGTITLTRQIKYIYLFSLLPLLIGSLTFIYGFYSRTLFAKDAHIQVAAFISILLFLIFGLTSFILTIIFLSKNLTEWRKILLPILVLPLTIFAIDIYSNVYDTFQEVSYLRIINKSKDYKLERVWSNHYERQFFSTADDDEVFVYYPVYTYDFSMPSGSFEYSVPYSIDSLHISFRGQQNSIKSFHFSNVSKGDCRTFEFDEMLRQK